MDVWDNLDTTHVRLVSVGIGALRGGRLIQCLDIDRGFEGSPLLSKSFRNILTSKVPISVPLKSSFESDNDVLLISIVDGCGNDICEFRQ